MTNRSKTLYTGVTSALEERVFEHKQGIKGKFAATLQNRPPGLLRAFRGHPRRNRTREADQGTLRIKKVALIVSMNPKWKGLSQAWFVRHQSQPQRA
jgi:putative endonuclease